MSADAATHQPAQGDAMDELIAKYAEELQRIYEKRTAGAYTFGGVLTQFAWDAAPLLKQEQR